MTETPGPDRLAAAVAHAEQTAKELGPRRRRGVRRGTLYPEQTAMRFPEGWLDRVEEAAGRDGAASIAAWFRAVISDALRKSERRGA